LCTTTGLQACSAPSSKSDGKAPALLHSHMKSCSADRVQHTYAGAAHDVFPPYRKSPAFHCSRICWDVTSISKRSGRRVLTNACSAPCAPTPQPRGGRCCGKPATQSACLFHHHHRESAPDDLPLRATERHQNFCVRVM
jgi:hypothetical protein